MIPDSAVVFVDSGAWYALANERDKNHKAACRFMQGRYRLVTTNFVIDETITLVLARKDYWAALNIGNEL